MRRFVTPVLRDSGLWRRVAIALTTATACLSWPATREAIADITLSDIIANVRASEATFDNCESKLSIKYELHRKPFPDTAMSGGISREIVASESLATCIRQKGMFRVDVQEAMHYETKDSVPELLDRVRLFDGKTTRAKQGSVVNIIDGITQDSDLIRPHMMIVEKATSFSVPLSSLLQGERAILAAGAKNIRGSRFPVELLGESTIDGLHCYKVRCHAVNEKTGYVHFSATLWLSPARNWMPVRCEAIRPKWSETKIDYEATVSRFTEIAPGVWCPAAARAISYVDEANQQTGEQVVNWEINYALEKMSLNPNYPLSTFGKLDVPRGAVVYDIDSSGKIVKSHVEGAPEPDKGP